MSGHALASWRRTAPCRSCCVATAEEGARDNRQKDLVDWSIDALEPLAASDRASPVIALYPGTRACGGERRMTGAHPIQ